ncbi:MAG: amidohydrolase family protein [Pseudomonadota bacterium]
MPAYTGPIIDAHHHLWTIKPGSHPWLDGHGLQRSFAASEYAAEFSDHTIVGTVWIEALAADPIAELTEAERVRLATQGRIGTALIAHAPLDADDVADRLGAYRAISPAFRGVRDILSPHLARSENLMARPGFLRGLRALAAHGLAFEAMLVPDQMRVAAALFRQVPELPVALEHVGSPHDRSAAGLALWRAGLDALAALPNVVLKVSALQCLEPEWTDESLHSILAPIKTRFGAERMCVGTDWPVHDQTCHGSKALDALKRITADWSESEQESLFHRTARRLYTIT